MKVERIRAGGLGDPVRDKTGGWQSEHKEEAEITKAAEAVSPVLGPMCRVGSHTPCRAGQPADRPDAHEQGAPRRPVRFGAESGSASVRWSPTRQGFGKPMPSAMPSGPTPTSPGISRCWRHPVA